MDDNLGRSDAIIFAGTHRAARQVIKRTPRNALFIFHGQGVNPIVVLPDADLESAVDGIMRSSMYNSGQDCAAPNWLFPVGSAGEGVKIRDGGVVSLR